MIKQVENGINEVKYKMNEQENMFYDIIEDEKPINEIIVKQNKT